MRDLGMQVGNFIQRKEVEAALIQSEERYRLITQNSSDLISLVDMEGRYVYASPSHERLAKVRPTSLLGANIFDQVHPEDLRNAKKMWNEVQAVGRSQATVRIKRASGYRWIETNASLITEGDTCVLLTGRDVTERLEAEEALRQSEERLKVAISSSPVTIYQQDLDLRYTYALNVPEPVMSTFRPGFSAKEVAPEKSDELDELKRTVLQSGVGLRKTISASGPLTGRSYDLTVEPLRGHSGELIGVTCAAVDVTDALNIQKALEYQEWRYRTVFEEATDGLIVCTTEGKVLEANRAALRILGAQQEQLCESALAEHLSAEYRREASTVFEQTLHSGHGSFVSVCERPDGSSCPVECATALLGFDDQHHILVVMRDISDRVRAEEARQAVNEELERRVGERTQELLQANQELEAFSYSVSHDLRSPLRSMNGFSKALLDDYGDLLDDDGKDYLNRIMKAANRMGQLIDDLLQLASVGRSDLRRTRIDFSSLAHEVREQLLAAEPGRDVEFEIQPNLVIHGDLALLRVVLENLMGNAFKFTSKRTGARISVGSRETPSGQAFFVEDNGEGFDQLYASSLFQPFQRLHSPKEFPGTGIGLATVKRVVHRHGGDVWAEGRPGNGATIYFSL